MRLDKLQVLRKTKVESKLSTCNGAKGLNKHKPKEKNVWIKDAPLKFISQG
jgi:hypothetical protein